MAKVVKCYVCRHPNRKEIDEALKGGMTQTEIQRTLCPDIKKHSVQRHYALDHHLQEPGADWSPATIPTRRTKSSKRVKLAKPTRPGGTVKVHWELPRALVKKLKHRAVDEEIPAVQLARNLLEQGL